MTDLSRFAVRPGQSLVEVFECLHRNGRGIAVALDDDRRLLGTITDGDLRGAVLSGVDLKTSVATWMQRRREGGALTAPITAPAATDASSLLTLMQRHSIRHVPILDPDERVVDVVCMPDILGRPEMSPTRAVVMAGGLGSRLQNLTADVPKPMLPVGDRPVIEHLVRQLTAWGVTQVSIATHYKSDTIVDHFGDGNGFGVSIDYLREDHPLGTAGALGLMRSPKETLLVINGDILTRIDFGAFAAFHREHAAAMTIGVRKYDIAVPYGVVETVGYFLRDLVEKPTHSVFVNAGIYLIEPQVHELIPRERRFDMTDLIAALLERGLKIATFPILEYWLDIGLPGDYAKAKADAEALDLRT